MPSCGCDNRREIMFTHGGLDLTCVCVLVAIPVTVYLLGRILK